ncbi:MAG: hypothetical protein N3E45_08685 [Oscillatoriaceae bacterium SKW80]|nr:hypothetical protein [Oscillatoriaceae bacterium SKYG93]MCX8120895.1 hypothetical protein [Oscillatoriaceae bacterium SKW80]MDW8452168.1 hypothetical protein [Oscillatoriaceae cyanobacterium SKYGB_i_bin93]
MTIPANTITLESSERLIRKEFEYRYIQSPPIKKAELINGVVFVASPIIFRKHAHPHGQIIVWLGTYATFIRGLMLHFSHLA